MRRFVLDCSVTMAWCFESEADGYTLAVLGALADGTAIVPPLWPLEVANVLLVAERRRRITRGDVARFLDLLADLPLVVAAPVAVDDMSALVGLGRDHALSAYDAAYLHLALQEHPPLATRDRALRPPPGARVSLRSSPGE